MRSSLDPYSTIRSGYRQRRASDIANRDTGAPATTGTGYGVGAGSFGGRTPADPAPR